MQVILHADQRPKQNHKDENLPALPQEPYLLGKELGTDVEPEENSLSDYAVSKKVIHLLRHSQTVQREEDGAVQFWRIENFLQSQFPQVLYWSDDRWEACLAAGGGAKRRYQYCTDVSGIIVYFRALQGHSGCNLIDPTLQDKVIYSEQLLPVHVSCRMLQSIYIFIINSGLIPGGQNFEQQTDSILSACESHGHKP